MKIINVKLNFHFCPDDPTVYNTIKWEANHGLNISYIQKASRKLHANYLQNRKNLFYAEVKVFTVGILKAFTVSQNISNTLHFLLSTASWLGKELYKKSERLKREKKLH